MSQYVENLKKYIPLMNTKTVLSEPGRKSTMHFLEVTPNVPERLGIYKDAVNEYKKIIRHGAVKKIILVGDCTRYMIKAAGLMAIENFYTEEESSSGYVFDYEYDIDDDDNGCMEEIIHELQFPLFEEDGPKKTIPQTDVDNKAEAVICTGLTLGNVNDQYIDIILSIKASLVFVAMNEADMTSPETQRLIYEGGFHPLYLKPLPKDYYENIVDYLIENNTENDFEESISAKWISDSIIRKRGDSLREEDFAIALTHAALEASLDNRMTIMKRDFANLFPVGKKSKISELNSMIGLDKVKDLIEQLIAIKRESQHNPKFNAFTGGIIFCGEPGTGKTTTANLIAECMADAGVSNGRCIVATRQDIIGQYVGHTAPKVAKLFKAAKGGVLFVDEAGFFAKSGSGSSKGSECYVDEAIKEFVRYMEIDRDTTVIFAMYNSELDSFLELDAGLSSRMSRIINFPSYTEDELTNIFIKMLDDNGYKLNRSKTEDTIRKYITDRKKSLNERFGNAREMRKLAESSITMAGIRHSSTKWSNEITNADIKNAIDKILTENEKIPEKKFGFVYG